MPVETIEKEAGELVNELLALMPPEHVDYPEGFYEALQLAHAIQAFLRSGEPLSAGPERDAVLFVASRLIDALHTTETKLERMSQILLRERRLVETHP